MVIDMKWVTTSELNRKTYEVLKEIPVAITRNGKPIAMLVEYRVDGGANVEEGKRGMANQEGGEPKDIGVDKPAKRCEVDGCGKGAVQQGGKRWLCGAHLRKYLDEMETEVSAQI